jgi:CheY-like chemotaxis protein
MGQDDDNHLGPPAGSHWEGVRVLVVDDDPLVRVLVQLGLERDGFEVQVAATGREALRLFRARPAVATVVLLDIRMPGLDGPQTLDALRELDPAVRAGFMSGDLGTYDAEALRRRGAAFMIAKPFRMDELAGALRLLAQGVTANPLPTGDGGPG